MISSSQVEVFLALGENAQDSWKVVQHFGLSWLTFIYFCLLCRCPGVCHTGKIIYMPVLLLCSLYALQYIHRIWNLLCRCPSSSIAQVFSRCLSSKEDCYKLVFMLRWNTPDHEVVPDCLCFCNNTVCSIFSISSVFTLCCLYAVLESLVLVYTGYY